MVRLTNVVMAVGPGPLWRQRGSRQGSSVGLAIVVLVGTINTFLPPGYGMWTTASAYFDQPWFYLSGVVVTLIALRNLALLLGYPPKEKTDRRNPIW